jgi:hypothetical protein
VNFAAVVISNVLMIETLELNVQFAAVEDASNATMAA